MVDLSIAHYHNVSGLQSVEGPKNKDRDFLEMKQF